MTSVRMRTDSAGPAGNRYAGRVYPVAADEGWELVRGGFAEWVGPPRSKPVEAAVQPQPETAVRVKKPARKGKR